MFELVKWTLLLELASLKSLTSSVTLCGITTTIEENKVRSSLQTLKYAETVIY